MSSDEYESLEYSAPDDGLELLRYEILNDTVSFDAAFREYIKRWAFKHPAPADFFHTMNDVLGQNLDWFWQGWFERTDVVDLAVDSVVSTPSQGRYTNRVFLSNRGTMPMVVPVTLHFAGGSAATVKLPVDVWRNGSRYLYERTDSSRLIGVEIDGEQNLPDVRPENNRWFATKSGKSR